MQSPNAYIAVLQMSGHIGHLGVMATTVRPISAMLDLTYHERHPSQITPLDEIVSAVRSLGSPSSVLSLSLVAVFGILLKLPALWSWSTRQLRNIGGDTVPQARNVTAGQLASKVTSGKFALLG